MGPARMRMFWEPLAVCRMIAFCNALCVLGVQLFSVADYLYSARVTFVCMTRRLGVLSTSCVPRAWD